MKTINLNATQHCKKKHFNLFWSVFNIVMQYDFLNTNLDRPWKGWEIG